MFAILSSLNAHNLPISQPILMLFVSKFMFYRALSYKTYLLLGLLSPLIWITRRLTSLDKCTLTMFRNFNYYYTE